MEDDFEAAFADELDALRDFEEDFYQPSQPIKRLSSQGDTCSTSPLKEINHDNSNLQTNTSNRKVFSTVARDWEIPEDLLADAAGFAETSASADVVPCRKIDQTEKEAEKKSRKRDAEDLFGPLSDSEGELVIDAELPRISPRPKRARKLIPSKQDKKITDKEETSRKDISDKFEITPPSSPTADEKALVKVQMHRTRIQNMDRTVPMIENTRPTSSLTRPNAMQRVLTRQPAGTFITVTNQDGCRVYLKKSDTLSGDKKCTKKASSRKNPLQLLSTSMGTLILQIERERHRNIIKEAERISSSIRNNEEMSDEDNDGEKPSNVKEPSLWVDKYAPKKYTELLSDDGVNRNLLFWLKLWDKVVFNRERKVTKRAKKQDEKKNKPPAFKSKWQQQDVIEEVDEQKRPVHKIALLCGPPGLGKTTLAHVIARHAGYNVVEMNASDDRSQDVFRTKLENSIQMKSVLTPDNRPNCLIIDEIDGAPTPAINVLLNMIKRTEVNPGGKKKKKQPLLMRPIICICNDPYVPSLRQLRQVAFVTHFPQTLSARLASRLQQITKNNALRADMTALMALCSKADNDIRSCLNTLQFLHSKGTALTLRLVHSLSVGQKDKHKGLFSVWQDIFQLPKPQRKRYANPHDVHEGIVSIPNNRDDSSRGLGDEANVTSLSSRFQNVLQEVQASGEYEKMMQGVFENFLEVKFKDPHLEASEMLSPMTDLARQILAQVMRCSRTHFITNEKVSKKVNLSYEWLAFSDLLQTEINHMQNYIFMRYLPFTPVMFHMMFASTTRPQIKYPNTQYEVTTKQNHTSNLITTMLSEVAPRIASGLNPRTLVMDILSHLILVIQPSLRPVNTQLFNSHEKRQLAELIDTMIAYNLTYHQERSAEGQYNYVLDPNIEEVVRFSGAPPVKQMTYSSKQLIAREISLEKMRRTEKSVAQHNRNPPDKKQQAAKGKEAGTAIPRHKEKLIPKKINVPDNIAPARDFFGRLIPQKCSQNESDGSSSSNSVQKKEKERKHLKTSTLWYKFNEGFCNAVRQNIRIQDLL